MRLEGCSILKRKFLLPLCLSLPISHLQTLEHQGQPCKAEEEDSCRGPGGVFFLKCLCWEGERRILFGGSRVIDTWKASYSQTPGSKNEKALLYQACVSPVRAEYARDNCSQGEALGFETSFIPRFLCLSDHASEPSVFSICYSSFFFLIIIKIAGTSV